MNVPQELRDLVNQASETKSRIRIWNVSSIVQTVPDESPQKDLYYPEVHDDKQTVTLGHVTATDQYQKPPRKSQHGSSSSHPHPQYSLPSTNFRVDLAGCGSSELAYTIVHESLPHLLEGYSLSLIGWGQGGLYKSGMLHSYLAGANISLLQMYLYALLGCNEEINVYLSLLKTEKNQISDLLSGTNISGSLHQNTFRSIEDALSGCNNVRIENLKDFAKVMSSLTQEYRPFLKEVSGECYVLGPPEESTGLIVRVLVENRTNGTCPSLFLVDTPPIDTNPTSQKRKSPSIADFLRAAISQGYAGGDSASEKKNSDDSAQALSTLRSNMLARFIGMTCRSSRIVYSLLFLYGSKTRGTVYNLLRIQQTLGSLETVISVCHGAFDLPLTNIPLLEEQQPSDEEEIQGGNIATEGQENYPQEEQLGGANETAELHQPEMATDSLNDSAFSTLPSHSQHQHRLYSHGSHATYSGCTVLQQPVSVSGFDQRGEHTYSNQSAVIASTSYSHVLPSPRSEQQSRTVRPSEDQEDLLKLSSQLLENLPDNEDSMTHQKGGNLDTTEDDFSVLSNRITDLLQ